MRLRAVAVALAIGCGLLAAPAAAPPPAAGVGPLPDCRLDDILTSPNGYDDWAVTQVDWILSLGKKYRPPDLVRVSEAGIAAPNGGYIREVALADLTAMAAAARDNGTPIVALSPYRGYRQQVALFNGYAGWTGTRYTNFDNAVTFSARPGHSEHQTGLTIDFVAPGETGLRRDWESTPTGEWMAKNAWKFGWLMSYPRGKQDVTCYMYEPWHYRYVGRDMAVKIRESGLTIREYLWANHSTVDPVCVAVPSATLETTPSPRPCPLPSPSPSAPSTGPPPSVAPSAPAPSPIASPAPTPTATAPPTAPTGGLFGLDPVVAVVAALLLLAAIGLVVSLRLGRRGGWVRRARR